jgi:hypothetical protein
VRPLHGMNANGSRSPKGHGAVGATKRFVALALVAAAVAAVAVLDGRAGRPAPSSSLQPVTLAAEAAPLSSQSSAWYCTGGSGPADPVAQSRLLLVNAGPRPDTAALEVVDAQGRRASRRLLVPARGQVDEVPGTLVAGTWLAATVEASAGGLTVAELVRGPSGWSVAPCASETSPSWYFADGSTQTGNSLWVSLYDPTADLAVVDLSFVTQSGPAAPAPYQGIVIPPGKVVTVTVGTYVQNQSSVATEVTARSGAVVAAELELFGRAGLSGMALRLGAPATAHAWLLPRAVDPTGGTSALSVLNPSGGTDRVRVDVHLRSGSVAPFEQVVGPESVWTLETSEQGRIPPGADYSVRVTASGPSGVVVDRDEAGPVGSPAPQWGAGGPLPVTSATVARRWVVPALAGVSTPGAPLLVAVENPEDRSVHVTVTTLGRPGVERVRRFRLAADALVTLPAGANPLLVTTNGPAAVSGDVSNTGEALVAVPAVPQA